MPFWKWGKRPQDLFYLKIWLDAYGNICNFMFFFDGWKNVCECNYFTNTYFDQHGFQWLFLVVYPIHQMSVFLFPIVVSHCFECIYIHQIYIYIYTIYLHLPDGAERMIRGDTTSLRVLTAPELEDAGIIVHQYRRCSMYGVYLPTFTIKNHSCR